MNTFSLLHCVAVWTLSNTGAHTATGGKIDLILSKTFLQVSYSLFVISPWKYCISVFIIKMWSSMEWLFYNKSSTCLNVAYRFPSLLTMLFRLPADSGASLALLSSLPKETMQQPFFFFFSPPSPVHCSNRTGFDFHANTTVIAIVHRSLTTWVECLL